MDIGLKEIIGVIGLLAGTIVMRIYDQEMGVFVFYLTVVAVIYIGNKKPNNDD
jgi:hypothetical protein